MKENLKSDAVDLLFDCILQLKNADECYDFFEDICTVHEIQSLAQRLEVAKLLKQKETYQAIAAKTGASTATISRVNRSLTYGNDSYTMIFERLGDEKNDK
ncbi:MAG: helix-turn-helix domain-containing protein [Firmicutes bacterium]|nr:helix-turn-helix domain-containing protein [Bacillota bacterium]